jgi:hypothetical protein
MKLGSFLLPISLLTLATISCGKSNSGTKPQFSLESINLIVEPGDSMRAMFKFNSAIANDIFGSLRTYQQQVPPLQPSGGDTILTPIPSFPGGKGEIRFALDHDYLSASSSASRNDTVVLKFFIMTPDSLTSDTITSPPIAIINP